MAAQALYRKWRPRTFDEVVGQAHVVGTLRNALVSGRIHHAYLFAGPRGTGKTTLARLLAKAVNCLAPELDQRPCNACAICQSVNEGRLIDLIEIDAASNTGVDDVRELRERVGFRPNQARYKVYVVDEVHMLSNAAFNALLKTLEEPPPHAIFVLATTEPHKIPDTVLSRCQRFNFRRIPVDEVVERLEWITRQEQIPADRDALTIIARQATGSMRDAESLLDQLASYDEKGITVAEVRAALGTGASEAVIRVTDALSAGDMAQGLGVINTAINEGADPAQFARQMVQHLRALLLLRFKSGVVLIQIAEDLRPQLEEQAARFLPRALARAVRLFNQAATEAKSGWHPQLPLEMAFIEAALSDEQGEEPKTPVPARRSRSTPDNPRTPSVQQSPSLAASPSSSSSSSASSPVHRSAPARSASPAPVPSTSQSHAAAREPGPAYDAPEPGDGAAASLTPEMLRDVWSGFLNALRPRNLSLEALMRACKPLAVEGDVVVLGFDYDFHRGKVEEDHNRRDVEDTLSELLGRRCRVRCVLAQQAQPGLDDVPSPSLASDSAGEVSTPSVDQMLADDPVVRAAVEDLGAEIVQSP
jgi:DNA polymerase-3 subunit gamma/tau